MAKQVIVVVHGVGVKQAGVSADLLATSLEATPEEMIGLKRENISCETLHPHSSDDFHLRELGRYSKRNLRQTFPARIRRYRQYDSKEQGAVANERVVADFYWGDIAAIGAGVFGLMVALLKTILGLAHAIRENARDVFPGSSGLDRWMRRIASGAALTIHGPIAAINVVLIIGILLAWALHAWLDMELAQPAAWSGLAVAVLVIVGGLVALRLSYAYLARLFAGWVLVTGVVLLVFWLDGFLATDPFAWADALLKDASCRFALPEEDAYSCTAGYTGLYLYGLRLLALVSLGWLVVFVLALVTGTVVFWRRKERRQRKVFSLLMPAIGLMTLLWFLMLSSIWAAIGNMAEEVIPHPAYIRSGIWGSLPALIALIALLGAALIAWRRKSELSSASVQDYLSRPEYFAERYRLIVSRGMMGVLVAFLIGMLLISLGAIVNFVLDDRSPLAGIFTEIARLTPYAMTVAALIGTLMVGVFRTSFAAGLGILTDVLTYLNDYSWDSRGILRGDAHAAPIRKGSPSGTAMERIPGGREQGVESSKPHGYWRRERIQDRLKVLINQLIRDERPDVLTLVSHSQGTVIAIDVIDEEGGSWLAAMPTGGRITLVTMGSPYTHLHHHFFPSSFPCHHDRPALRKRDESAELSKQNPGVLSRWVNIFRVDDFVGTHIDSPNSRKGAGDGQALWPEENPVAGNGHTMYWVDENVFPILREVLRFQTSTAVGTSKVE
jgi:hypothetical protein